MVNKQRTTQEFLATKITLKERENPINTLEIWLTNSPAIFDNDPFIAIPILDGFSGVGVTMNRFTPQQQSGQLRLKNGRDSLALQKRFSDLLHRYVLMGSSLQIYSTHNSNIYNQSFFADKSLLWQGKITSVEYQTNGSETGQLLSLGFSIDQVKWEATKQITSEEFPDIPERSRNQYLPLVFGVGIQCSPVWLSSGEGTEESGTRFAYATNLWGTSSNYRFRNGGISQILAVDPTPTKEKEREKEYKRITSTPFGTPIYSQTSGTVTSRNKLNRARAYPIAFNPVSSAKHIVTSGRIRLQGNGGSVTPEGEIEVKLHSSRKVRNRPRRHSEALATAIISKEDYTADYNGGGSFWANFIFDKPVAIVGDRPYWISFEASGEEEPGSNTNFQTVPFNAGTPAGCVSHRVDERKDGTDNAHLWSKEVPAERNKSARFELFGMEFIDEPIAPFSISADGLGVSSCVVKYNTFGGAEVERVEQLSNLDIVLSITGLKDEDGLFSVGSTIDKTHQQVEVLLMRYDGSKWVGGNFNRARFSNTHTQMLGVPIDSETTLYRTTRGRTWQKSTNLDILKKLTLSSCSALTNDVVGGNLQYSLFCFGKSAPQTLTLSDDDVNVTSYFIGDLSLVANVANINYERRIVGVGAKRDYKDGKEKDYFSNSTLSYKPSTLGESLSLTSYNLYGENSFPDSEFDYIYDGVSAKNVAQLFLRMGDHPPEYVEFTLPLSYETDIKLYDKILLLSAELPYFRGTSQQAFSQGCKIIAPELKQVRELKILVISKKINYTKNGIQQEILGRLLINKNEYT